MVKATISFKRHYSARSSAKIREWDGITRTRTSRQKRNSKYVADREVYPRAGTLGGCTVHNLMITIYPNNTGMRSQIWGAIPVGEPRICESTLSGLSSAAMLSDQQARTTQHVMDLMAGWLPRLPIR